MPVVYLSCVMRAGISELSLRQLPIELDDLEQIKTALPQLRTLHLSGAQKLPPDAVSALLAPHHGRGICSFILSDRTMELQTVFAGLSGASGATSGYVTQS